LNFRPTVSAGAYCPSGFIRVNGNPLDQQVKISVAEILIKQLGKWNLEKAKENKISFKYNPSANKCKSQAFEKRTKLMWLIFKGTKTAFFHNG